MRFFHIITIICWTIYLEVALFLQSYNHIGRAAGAKDCQEGELGEEQGGDRGGGHGHRGGVHIPGCQGVRVHDGAKDEQVTC